MKLLVQNGKLMNDWNELMEVGMVWISSRISELDRSCIGLALSMDLAHVSRKDYFDIVFRIAKLRFS